MIIKNLVRLLAFSVFIFYFAALYLTLKRGLDLSCGRWIGLALIVGLGGCILLTFYPGKTGVRASIDLSIITPIVISVSYRCLVSSGNNLMRITEDFVLFGMGCFAATLIFRGQSK